MKGFSEWRIDLLNIGLMLGSALFAFFFPFETFLLAYAILGPLHYLTEISWLHDRNYFTKGRYDFVFLLLIGVLISFGILAKDNHFNRPLYDQMIEANLFDLLPVLALFTALLFVTLTKTIPKLIGTIAIYLGLSWFFSRERAEIHQTSTLVFGLTVLLPTLIHVYLFTFFFMFFGALKTRSKSGILSVAALVIIPIILFFFPPSPPGVNHVSRYGKETYYANGNGFFYLNAAILSHFNLIETPPIEDGNEEDLLASSSGTENLPTRKGSLWDAVFFSGIGISLMRFIAFAYLYHYLNWFSKTEIIRWHQVPRRRLLGVIAIWVLSCVIYAYDYQLGLACLFFLSFTHVLLEFPLNILSMIGIAQESIGVIRSWQSRRR
ncbi:MAG: hypothetical protein KGP28_10285 [Bdellovibrionales bacterium]|nr:hypothetical protein [Bdellovibrionales bacterium]